VKKYFLLSSTAVLITPLVVLAQADDLFEAVIIIGGLVQIAIPIAVALALLFFFWGLAKYILSAGSEDAATRGRDIMIWGIIALFVIVSIWGLVAVLANTFEVQRGGGITPPQLKIELNN